MFQFIKKHKGLSIGLIVIVVVIYFVVGAIAPFIWYKEIQPETVASTDIVERVYEENTDVDRALLLESNQSAWEERIRLLNLATNEIILSTFDIREGKSTTDLASVLLNKAEQGVKVYLLVDGMNGRLRIKDNPFFYALTSHENVELRLYNPINILTPWTSQGRMHDKYVIVDDIGYILGGRNTFDYFIGDYRAKSKSYDREVLIYNTAHGKENETSSITQIKSYFDSVWNSKYSKTYWSDTDYADMEEVKDKVSELHSHYEALFSDKKDLFDTYDYIENTVSTSNVQLISGDIGIYGKEPVVLYELSQLMLSAKDRVLIHTPYAVCNDYMYQVLEDVANQVPNASVMLNSTENGDNFFASSDYRINKKSIVDTGITIYEYDGGVSYHGKSIVIDDTISIIGSFNYDLRSVYMDTELMLVVNSKELTSELTENMKVLEKDCRTVINETDYIVPDHIEVKEIPKEKHTAMKIVGRIVQIARCLL